MDCRKVFYCICNYSFQLGERIVDLIHSHLLGMVPAFVKGSSPSLHITWSSHELPNQVHSSVYTCTSAIFPVSHPIEKIDYS